MALRKRKGAAKSAAKATAPAKPNRARAKRVKAVIVGRDDLNYAEQTELERLHRAGNLPQEGENPLQGRMF